MRFSFPLILLICATWTSPLLAQERCAQAVMEKTHHPEAFQKREDTFEKWIQKKLASKSTFSTGRTKAGPYTIPVVVHVVHNGEVVGTGTNISDAQVLSQIDVLNKDYQRKNADAANTPAEFKTVAGALDIQFVLAKQDPNGLPTNGIERTKGSQAAWSYNDDVKLKTVSPAWPAENYLNIWVINFSDNFIGYAHFPPTDGVPLNGLDASESTDRSTDGVVIWYRAFGSSFNGFGTFNLSSQFNRGRTATHEVGHFFGLRHIWGDDSGACTGTDYVSDTPNQADKTENYPSCTHPKADACSPAIMFQNYMDYTNDVCMNLFTKGQTDRMEIVLNNSPRRNSLLSSIGATAPTGPPITDLSLQRLKSPGPVICTTSPTPTLVVKNEGSTVISQLEIVTRINDGAIFTKPLSGLQFLPGQEKEFQLDKLTLKTGLNTLNFIVQNPNGKSDDDLSNNSITINEVVNSSTDVIPLREDFNSDFSDWTLVTPRNNLNWQTTTTNYNTSLAYRSYTNATSGQDAWLVSPVLDFSAAPQASVLFDVSYATRSTGVERLQVFSSTDCGVTYNETEYDRVGSQFNSTSSTSSWQPSLKTDWQREFIELNSLAGKENVRLAFVVTNENGNNLYIDNLEFFISDNPNPPEVDSPYYVYASSAKLDEYMITFNLENRTDVQLYIYDLVGQKVAEQFLPNTLNQTYPIEFANEVPGIYIVRLQIGGDSSSAKIFVGR
jgi:hypothetical protein